MTPSKLRETESKSAYEWMWWWWWWWGGSWVASMMWDPEVGTWGLQLEALGNGGCQGNKEVLL